MTTNYSDTFIQVATDSKAKSAIVPVEKGGKETIASLQYKLIVNNPYKYTSDDVLFLVFAKRNEISPARFEKEREKFFAKSQACLRSSPLGKSYGWGIHSDSEGRTAIYGVQTKEYKAFSKDRTVKQLRAMRSSRAVTEKT